MNILDKLNSALAMQNVYLGVLPNKPDACISLTEYPGAPPNHHFGGTDFTYNIQARIRDTTSATAFARAEAVAALLNRYSDADISVLQATSILDIGVDNANPPRHEYTVNFQVRRY